MALRCLTLYNTGSNIKVYMAASMKNLTALAEWQALVDHHSEIADQQMRDWFVAEPLRHQQFSLETAGIRLDYSRNRITAQTQILLSNLAQAVHLSEQIDAQINGQPINVTEKRAVLHTALRDQLNSKNKINGENIFELVQTSQQTMREWTAQIHSQQWRGVTGKPIQHIINIGVGGSYLGPMMTVHALKDFAVSGLQFHFLSTADPALWQDILQKIDPEQTLFIISSKSFSTLETMTNAHMVLDWMKQQLGEAVIQTQFVAITAVKEKALAFGLPENRILPLWDWIGGRYSIWSAIGWPLMLMIGAKQFTEFLTGAYEMDRHFQQAPFPQNMPVMMALLNIWYSNFFHTQARVIAPYAYRLRHLIAYLQQAEMESNGKNTSLNHTPITYKTGSVVFGGEGCHAQHAYHQLLHQGQHLIPVDFIVVNNTLPILLASGLSQAQALMHGKTYDEAYQALLAADVPIAEAQQLACHQVHPGNRPSNILCLNALTPATLGALLALYEHKIFVEGVIWQINSFDQWGVELGKQLLPGILRQLTGTV
ncbi:MAG TPA: glucose-6-phosphate isomerase [Gammaproteobacteria bacterium]|nr:glucose-6-phosphate isomerase [Gammaproteobacteria bacterium]